MVASDGVRDAGVARDVGGSLAPATPGSGPERDTSRGCARPGCPSPAAATLRFAYTTREAVIEPLEDERPPQTYDLCGPHAARTRPPHGWTLRDLLSPSVPSVEASVPSVEPPVGRPAGDRDAVALLAAAFEAAANGSVANAPESSTG